MIIGIDDTDSIEGMCTTYLCAVLVAELKIYGEVSTPRLVRLNPCVPFKTRGNGAVSFEINVALERVEEVKEVVKARVSELSEVQAEGTNPGVVFIHDNFLRTVRIGGESETAENECIEILENFYETAVRGILRVEQACEIISKLQFDYFVLKKKRGLIGALAAASFLVIQRGKPDYYDSTFELVAYRLRERWGTSRFIEESSVWKADEDTYPLTWDTVDIVNNRLVLAPHSPCPVLFGIRGDSVDAIYKAHRVIRAEPVEREMLFITNQGTDSHLITATCEETEAEAEAELQDYLSYVLTGVVASDPRTIDGGHVVFALTLAGKTGGHIECIAYEPTKGFRNIIRKLCSGDKVTVYGSFKNRTINLEKIELRELNVDIKIEKNPVCEGCGKRMKSAGRSQGYRCKRCKTHCSEKEVQIVAREVETGLYEVPAVARRHIAKPLIRVWMEGGITNIHLSR